MTLGRGDEVLGEITLVGLTILDIHRLRGPQLFYYTEQTVEIYCLIFELLKYYFIRVIHWTL